MVCMHGIKGNSHIQNEQKERKTFREREKERRIESIDKEILLTVREFISCRVR